MHYKISLMVPEDLPEVMELERETFSSPWTVNAFVEELGREYSRVFLARDESGLLLGFVCFWVLLDEAHILNLAVRKEFRMRGIGTRLAVSALRYARKRGAKAATLEVREKNTEAVRLYEMLGFVRAGLRPGYYERPRDNAVIMWLYDIDSAFKKALDV